MTLDVALISSWVFIIAMIVPSVAVVALVYCLSLYGIWRYPQDLQHMLRTVERLAVVETQMSLFWRMVEKSLAARLHAPTHHEMDQLLGKLKLGEISTEEAKNLHRMIQERSDELIIEGVPRPSALALPELLTLWALEVRIQTGGGTVDQQVTE